MIFSMSSCSFICTSLSLCSNCSGSLRKLKKRLWLALWHIHKSIASEHTCICCWPYRIWIYSLDMLCSMGNTPLVLVCLHRSLARSHTLPAYERNLIWWRCWIHKINFNFIKFVSNSFSLLDNCCQSLTWKIIWQFHQTILSDSMIASNELRIWHATDMLCHPCQMSIANLPQFHKEWPVLHRGMHAFDFRVTSAASVSISSNNHRPLIGFVSITNNRRCNQLCENEK